MMPNISASNIILLHLRRISEHFGKDIRDISAEEFKKYQHHLKSSLNPDCPISVTAVCTMKN
jgi:hypothetical protein